MYMYLHMQMSTSQGHSLCYKLKDYFRNRWNILDVVILIAFGLCIVLRLVLNEQCFRVARAWYCITLGLYYGRIMQNFELSQNIGPKVRMIWILVRHIPHLRSLL